MKTFPSESICIIFHFTECFMLSSTSTTCKLCVCMHVGAERLCVENPPFGDVVNSIYTRFNLIGDETLETGAGHVYGLSHF